MTDIKYYSDPVDSTDYGVQFIEQIGRDAEFGDSETYTRRVKAIVPQAPGAGGEHYGPVVVANELRRQHGIARGAAYVLPSGETSETARCTSIKVTHESEGENQHVYMVEIEYGLPTWGAADNPLLAPPVWSWGEIRMDLPLWMDFDPSGSKPVCNSAGDLFEEPVRHPYTRSVLTVTRNELAYNELTAAAVRNKCNSATWNGFAPYTVLCDSITASHVLDSMVAGGGYDQVTYVFIIDTVLTHKVLRADAGWQTNSGGSRERIYNSDGSEPSSIPLLNGSGGLNTGDPVVLEFYANDVVDFNTPFSWLVI